MVLEGQDEVVWFVFGIVLFEVRFVLIVGIDAVSLLCKVRSYCCKCRWSMGKGWTLLDLLPCASLLD